MPVTQSIWGSGTQCMKTRCGSSRVMRPFTPFRSLAITLGPSVPKPTIFLILKWYLDATSFRALKIEVALLSQTFTHPRNDVVHLPYSYCQMFFGCSVCGFVKTYSNEGATIWFWTSSSLPWRHSGIQEAGWRWRVNYGWRLRHDSTARHPLLRIPWGIQENSCTSRL